MTVCRAKLFLIRHLNNQHICDIIILVSMTERVKRMADLIFKTSLTDEEIDKNFENINFFDGIMEGLNEALEYEMQEFIDDNITD